MSLIHFTNNFSCHSLFFVSLLQSQVHSSPLLLSLIIGVSILSLQLNLFRWFIVNLSSLHLFSYLIFNLSSLSPSKPLTSFQPTVILSFSHSSQYSLSLLIGILSTSLQVFLSLSLFKRMLYDSRWALNPSLVASLNRSRMDTYIPTSSSIHSIHYIILPLIYKDL